MFTASSAAPLDLASREPKGRFVASLLVEQRQGNRNKGCHLEGGGPPGSCSEPRIGRGLAVCPSHGSGQPSGSCTPLILPSSLLEGAGRDVLPCGKQIS